MLAIGPILARLAGFLLANESAGDRFELEGAAALHAAIDGEQVELRLPSSAAPKRRALRVLVPPRG